MTNVSLRMKMMGLCLVVTLLGIAGGVSGYLTLTSVATKYFSITQNDLPAVKVLGDLRGEFRELRIHVRSIGFVGNTDKDVEKYLSLATPAMDLVEKSFKEYERVDRESFQRESYKRLRASWEDFKKFGGELAGLAKDFEKNQTEIVRLIREVCPEKAAIFYNALQEETDLNLREAAASVSAATTAESQGKTFIIILALSALLLSLALGYLFATKISKTISAVVANLTNAGFSVAESAEKLGDSSEELSQASSESAASLEETVASLEELSSMVKRNTENAKEAAVLSSQSRGSAEKGEKEIQSLISSMNDISKSSKKIEEIINVIDDIAFQTNLLALNASVEAARAGEQGRGFAVVAEAVRSLAQRSGAAAKDITTLIKESVDQIDRGSEIADRSGEVLHNIVSSVNKVADLNSEIASASAEQAAGITQITEAMGHLDTSTQVNARSAESVAATIAEFNKLAATTQALTQELSGVVYGSNHQVKTPVAPVVATPAAVIPLPQERKKSLVSRLEDEGQIGTVEGF